MHELLKTFKKETDMKHIEAMKLALDHSEPSILSPGWTLVRNEDIAALREALAEQPAQEPVFSFQMQLRPGWGGQYPRAVAIGEPDIESLFGKVGDVVTFYASPQPAQQQQDPVAVRAAIVVNLVREGINKHRAKELADHFIGLATPQPAQRKPLDAGEVSRLWKQHTSEDGPHHNPYDDDGLGFARAIEAKLIKEKNT